jgi:peptidoglycan-N-acetylglucosamine deacetylase
LLTGGGLVKEIADSQLAYSKVYGDLSKRQCLAHNQTQQVVGLDTPSGQPSLLRSPFGACNLECLRTVGDMGLLAIQWDVSSGDPWRALTVSRMIDGVLRDVRAGSIVLFHANGRGWHTAEALRILVPELRSRGFELVTVSELLNIEGARPVISQTCYDVRPGDTDHYDTLARTIESRYEAFRLKFAPAAVSVDHQKRN